MMKTDLFAPDRLEPLETVVLHFDGGAKPVGGVGPGFGNCYGSYSFNGGKPVKMFHNVIASANTAELLTLCEGLDELARTKDASRIEVEIWGDSQIALKWAKAGAGHLSRAKISKGSSQPFREAILRLSGAIKPFGAVKTVWKPRRHAVAAFGH